MEHVFIDTIRGNSVHHHSAVVSEMDYPYDWNALMRGEEVPCEWDEKGNPIAWDTLSNEQ